MAEANFEAMANAFRRQAENVRYPDYDPKEDFSLWLAGYRAKVKNAYGYTVDEADDFDAEIVRSLPGKLKPGSALETYERLPVATKEDYTLLTEALASEFVDPQQKARFLENFAYNKRKKGQSLKEFMQEIIKDQNRYSGMRDTVGDGAAAIPNIEKIRDGIRRFKKGIRNRDGKVDADQARHLRYNLLRDEDLNWENALEVASRWEAANDFEDGVCHSSSSSDSDDAVEKERCEKEKKFPGSSTKDKKTSAGVNLVDDSDCLTALAKKVEANAKDIQELRSGQEQMAGSMSAWKNEMDETLDQIFSSLQAIEDQTN